MARSETYHSTGRGKKLCRLFMKNSFFYTRVAGEAGSGYNYSRVKAWTKRTWEDLIAADKVLIPINLSGKHWVLAVINQRDKRFEYYDSDGNGTGAEHLAHIRQWFKDEHRCRTEEDLNLEDWVYHSCDRTPQQTNGDDCGVFVLKFAECVALDVDFDDTSMPRPPFGQEHMPILRDRICLDLVRQPIDGDDTATEDEEDVDASHTTMSSLDDIATLRRLALQQIDKELQDTKQTPRNRVARDVSLSLLNGIVAGDLLSKHPPHAAQTLECAPGYTFASHLLYLVRKHVEDFIPDTGTRAPDPEDDDNKTRSEDHGFMFVAGCAGPGVGGGNTQYRLKYYLGSSYDRGCDPRQGPGQRYVDPSPAATMHLTLCEELFRIFGEVSSCVTQRTIIARSLTLTLPRQTSRHACSCRWMLTPPPTT